MKNVIIFGASGGIGKHAVRHALDENYNVTAYLRNPSKLDITHENLNVIKGELDDYGKIRESLKGIDAVIWCIGIPMTGKQNHVSVKGHELLIRAMKETNVKRLIDWSTPSVEFENDRTTLITLMPKVLAGVFLRGAKKKLLEVADIVVGSGLDWTLVRFLAPTDGDFTGKIKVSFGEWINFRISRSDIAYFMVRQIEDESYVKSMPIIGS